MATSTKYTPDEVGDLGEALYEAGIRQQVEPGNLGKLLMVDIETGQWVLGSDQLEMARELHRTRPDASLYCLRIGYPAVDSFAGGLRPIASFIQDAVEKSQS